jgi:hypothetical protein
VALTWSAYPVARATLGQLRMAVPRSVPGFWRTLPTSPRGEGGIFWAREGRPALWMTLASPAATVLTADS